MFANSDCGLTGNLAEPVVYTRRSRYLPFLQGFPLFSLRSSETPASPGAGGNRGGDAGGPREAVASDPSGSGSIMASIQSLGLKLEPRKLPLDLLVVDHIEKTPTAN